MKKSGCPFYDLLCTKEHQLAEQYGCSLTVVSVRHFQAELTHNCVFTLISGLSRQDSVGLKILRDLLKVSLGKLR